MGNSNTVVQDSDNRPHAEVARQKVKQDKFRPLSMDDVLKLPFPGWLVKGILPSRAFAMMFGASGAGKSFIALELAYHVATGRPWRGHKVKTFPVVYIVAEGQAGIRQRVEALLRFNGWSSSPNLHFVMDAPDLKSGNDLKLLGERIRALDVEPGLIVVDTFARCFHGDENSSGEVGAAIREVDTLRASCGGGTVLFVHHSKKGEKDVYRGSSALKGALDCMIAVEETDSIITVSSEKQKDAKAEKGITLSLHQVVLPFKDEWNEPVTSCALVAARASLVQALTQAGRNQQKCMSLLDELGSGSSVSNTEWKKRAKASGISASMFEKAKEALLNDGVIERTKQGRNVCWSFTVKGKAKWRAISADKNDVGSKSLPSVQALRLVSGSAEPSHSPDWGDPAGDDGWRGWDLPDEFAACVAELNEEEVNSVAVMTESYDCEAK